MKKILAILAALLVAQGTHAQEIRPQIAYCASPEVTAEMEENLPGFKVTPPDHNAEPTRGIFSINYAEIMRSRYFSEGGVTCIGVAIDRDGVAHDLYVHPKRQFLGRAAKRDLLKLQYNPRIIDGESSPAIFVISIAK